MQLLQRLQLLFSRLTLGSRSDRLSVLAPIHSDAARFFIHSHLRVDTPSKIWQR